MHHDAYDFWNMKCLLLVFQFVWTTLFVIIICRNGKIEHKWFWWFTCTICEFQRNIMQNRILLGHWDHEYRIAKTAWLLHWEKIVAHFHIYCHEGTRMPKTLSSLQKWLMISLCTSFIHNFYTFWNTHKIKQWWSYFNTIKVVLILECNFVS